MRKPYHLVRLSIAAFITCAIIDVAENNAQAQSGITVSSVANISAMQAVPSPAANQAVLVNGIQGGTFTFSTSACNNSGSGDGGTQFPPALGTGCWNRVLPTPALNPLWYGAKFDGATDDSAALQATENWAAAYLLPINYPGGTSVFNTTITMGIGVEHRGAGRNATTFRYHGTGWAYQLLLPNGGNIINAPTFYHMAIVTNSGVGGIKYNDPGHGFTNDPTSQQYMWKPIIDDVEFDSAPDNSGSMAIQCSKCFNANFNNNYTNGFTTAFDMEGSDTSKITNNAIYNPGMQAILAIAHSSFGNDLVIAGNDMPGIASGGKGFIHDGYNSAWIHDNHMEQNGSTISWTIYLDATTAGAPIAGITHNDMNVSTGVVASWLAVNGSFQEIYAVDNINRAGGSPAPAIFNSGSGAQYWYNGIAQQLIIHNGNLDADTGFPYNSVPANISTPAAPIPKSASTFWDFTPDNPGMVNTGAGLTTMVQNEAFAMVPNATPQPVTFRPQYHGLSSLPNGMDVYVCGWSSNGGTLVTVSDGATASTQILNASNLCYLMFSNDNIASGQIQVWNADTTHNGTVFITDVKIVYH